VTAQVEVSEEMLRTAPVGMVNPVQQWYTCDNATGPQQIPGVRWVDAGPGSPPAAAPAPPPSAAVALMLYARVQTLMEAPRLATNPPGGAPAIVGIPVFVSVENWQGELNDRQCVLGVCVDMTASPSLEFVPGEPEAPVIRCDPPGSQFDAARGDARAQASVPGACAYAYQQRTGVDERPAEWPAEVRVRWAVSWTSNVGVSGTFPELTFSSSAARVVNEVQTVVADGE
jgi:hypothetical protein